MEKNLDNEAAGMFQAILEQHPEDLHAFNRLGIAFRKQGKHDEAIREYRKAIQIGKDDENLYYNLGRACLEAGMVEEAVTRFREALEINPGFEEARRVLEEVAKEHSMEG